MPSKMRTLFICRQRGLRISTATVRITLMWRQHGHGVGCDHSVSRPTTALAPFFVRTLPDPHYVGVGRPLERDKPCFTVVPNGFGQRGLL